MRLHCPSLLILPGSTIYCRGALQGYMLKHANFDARSASCEQIKSCITVPSSPCDLNAGDLSSHSRFKSQGEPMFNSYAHVSEENKSD